MTRILGMPIVYNSDSIDLGGFVEQIDRAAVQRTLQSDEDVVLLKNHNSDYPLARRSARSLTLRNDLPGLTIDAYVDENVSFAADLIHMIRRKDASGGSFAFRTVDDVWTLRNGKPHRRVLDMVIREVSVGVTFPAYPATALYVSERSMQPNAPQRSKLYFDTRLKLAR